MEEKIDDEFWLKMAADRISNSITSRETAADKLDTFLEWIWGIYTSIFALASFFDAISSNIWQLIWVAQPILILMVARYCCHSVSLPSMDKKGEFNVVPDNVPAIMDTFKLIVQNKKSKLRVARFFTLVSIFSLMASLIGYNYCNPEKDLKQQIKIAILEKDLYTNKPAVANKQSTVNDSIKLINAYLDAQIQNITKEKKLKCIRQDNGKCADSIVKTSK